jgi:DNA-binding response OmpR family regulator
MRILIVEDEEKLAAAIKRGFEKEGFAVDYILNGDQAATRISLYRNEYDVVILDLMLPGKSGEDICREIRGLGITIPILVLTARTTIDDKVDLLDIGADDYMIKPFAFRELLARIHALLRRPKDSKPLVLSWGDLTLDPLTHTAHRGKRKLDLTLKEFTLLELFMRSPNEIIKREDILDHLWEFDFTSFSNVVDVHIKNLRKKIGKDSSRILETVRGVGYRLVG